MIRPFGESALLIELDGAERAQALAATLRADPVPGMVGVVPGLSSLLVELDLGRVDPAEALSAVGARVSRPTASALRARERTIPVVYGGAHGPDLPEVARLCRLSEEEVAERHAAVTYRVLFDGFAPGFAYLGGVPPELRVPRLATPRTRTPAGSVALAESMSGVYPAELPGGWRVIGRTPVTLFDPRRDPPAYLGPGDVVRFEPIAPADWDAMAGAPEDW